MVDLETIKDRSRPHILAPDNAATMRARDAAKSGRDLKELCGEDKFNMSKVDITITTNQNFLDQRFVATLANHCGLAEAMVKINKTVWDDMGNPLVYKFCRAIVLAISPAMLPAAVAQDCPGDACPLLLWLAPPDVGPL